MASIICADCGHHRHRCPRNTKYCVKCRLLRDLEFWAGKPVATCGHEHCSNTFARTYRHDTYCGLCQIGQTANRGSCQLCGGTDTYRIMRDVAVCELCARDPLMRVRFIRGLRVGQEARRLNPPAEELRQPTPRPDRALAIDTREAPEL